MLALKKILCRDGHELRALPTIKLMSGGVMHLSPQYSILLRCTLMQTKGRHCSWMFDALSEAHVMVARQDRLKSFSGF